MVRKTKTGYSTDARVLEELAPQHEIVAEILHYRQLIKLEGTYLSGLLPLVAVSYTHLDVYKRQLLITRSTDCPGCTGLPGSGNWATTVPAGWSAGS